MAIITSVAAQVAPVFPAAAEVYDFIAAEAITAGQPVYIVGTTGRVGRADADATGRQSFAGLALRSASAGQAVSVLKRGHVAGFNVTQANWSLVYVSNTEGALDDVAGAVEIRVGRVVALPDSAGTKVIYVEAEWR